MAQASPVIYILYNAKASLFGKLNYACRKLSAPASQSACDACDLTHGGLRLSESEEWKSTKQKIPAQIKQLHTDELTPEVWDGITFPLPQLSLIYINNFPTVVRIRVHKTVEISLGSRPELGERE